MGMEVYKIDSSPVCRENAIIRGEKYRISILTASMIRFEYDEAGIFENRPTQMVLNREFPVPEFYVKESQNELVIYTTYLEIHYNKKKFTQNGLRVHVKGVQVNNAIWHYGDILKDLKGTARTLDCADGEIPLEHGLISVKGFSVLDDSHSMALTEDGWIEARTGESEDFYFFGYGHRYLECLKDFYHLCGETPLLPRYALGNWWSRFYRYTQEEYVDLMKHFEADKIPFTVAVIDMDWHLTDEDVDPKYGNGWTGYTWNRKLFPDPKGFMNWLHSHGMKVTLNVHPADGIRGFEEVYPRVAKAMGIDEDSKETVVFDPTDPNFMEVYFKELHHPMEEEGVDFWWLDWQQGNVTNMEGLDPLWMLNHYHYLDNGWKGKRPITFSRYAGPGSHRYPIGFSGDTVISWESLDFQPYFTVTASNIGYGWWSHDIGGHMCGIRDDEMAARWVQFGVFSPINRLHSTANPFSGKEPWKYDKMAEETMKRYLRLRHGLIPYLYTMNRRASREGLPLMQPLYYKEPERLEAYKVPNEYYFGSELLVAPITTKISVVGRAAKVKTWLPEGQWLDFFSGMRYQGGRYMNLWRGLENIPVLMKAGAIVPMVWSENCSNSVENPAAMEVKIFPAADNHFTLWEDQGDTPEDLDENWVATRMELKTGEKCSFCIRRAEGNLDVIPAVRKWKLEFMSVSESVPVVTVIGSDGRTVKPDTVRIFYDTRKQSLFVELSEIDIENEITIDFQEGIKTPECEITNRCFDVLEKAQMEYNTKYDAFCMIKEDGRDAVGALMTLGMDDSVLGQLMEILTA